MQMIPCVDTIISFRYTLIHQPDAVANRCAVNSATDGISMRRSPVSPPSIAPFNSSRGTDRMHVATHGGIAMSVSLPSFSSELSSQESESPRLRNVTDMLLLA